ncbi:Kinesin-like protein kif27 [Rhizophlyctis rosea]|nr:Kinesin-like protein kif27 [Rhizophlyctis rosea]
MFAIKPTPYDHLKPRNALPPVPSRFPTPIPSTPPSHSPAPSTNQLTAEDIIASLRTRSTTDENFLSIEEFTSSAAFGLNLNMNTTTASTSRTESAATSATNIPSQITPTASSTSLSSLESADPTHKSTSSLKSARLTPYTYHPSPLAKSSPIVTSPSTSSNLNERRWSYDSASQPKDPPPLILSKSTLQNPNPTLLSRFERDLKRCMTPHHYLPGDFIIRKGDEGHEMYFISSGNVEVVSTDGKTVYATIHKGELSLLFSTPRTASIRASEPTTCQSIPKDAILALLTKYPKIGDRFCTVAAQRLMEINRMRAYRRKMEMKSRMDVVDELPEPHA